MITTKVFGFTVRWTPENGWEAPPEMPTLASYLEALVALDEIEYVGYDPRPEGAIGRVLDALEAEWSNDAEAMPTVPDRVY